MTENKDSDGQTSSYGIKSQNVKKWGERYLPQFKNKVIDFALKNSIREAVTEFKVNKGTVSDWLRSVPKVEKNQLKEEETPDFEFLKWLNTERKNGHLVSRNELNNKIQELSILFKDSEKKNFWFFQYAVRLQDKTNIKTRITYPKKFKEEVAKIGVEHSKKKVSMIFKIERKRISEWIECYLKGYKPITRRDPKRYLTDDKVDNEIWHWYQGQNSKPNSREVREKALKMYHAAGHTEITCSTGWYYRWRKRYSLLKCTIEKTNDDTELLMWVLGEFEKNRTVLHADLLNQAALLSSNGTKPSPSWAVRFSKRFLNILQNFPKPDVPLPPILEKKSSDFIQTIGNYISDKKLPSESIIAFDEIPLNFTTSGSTKSLNLLKKCGFDNAHASLILCCRADGILLPTTLITKTPAETPSSNCFNLVQENGINDHTTMEQWLQLILLHILNESVLICDIYDPHSTLEKLCKNQNLKISIIPLGCTPKLQPLSYGIGPKFKDEIEKQWIKWQENNSWNSKSIKVPLSSEMFNWVEKAHDLIQNTQQNFIQDCFIKAGYQPYIDNSCIG